ncbi:MAG: VWA domain-containing protein [Acidobacteriota bacterium]
MLMAGRSLCYRFHKTISRRTSLAGITVFLIITSMVSQTYISHAAQQGTTGRNEEDAVVRITTNLVQLDVVVTDKRGQQVTDLKPEDFEVLEDGRPQQITNFSYISVASLPSLPTPTVNSNTSEELALPPARLRPEQVRRTIALVVDDLGLSFESMNFTRQALKKFIDEQMQPNDLVALIRTGGSIGTLQQFTNDKRQLYAAVDGLHWNIAGRAGVNVVEQTTTNEGGRADKLRAAGADSALAGRPTPNANEIDLEQENQLELESFRQQFYAVGTLGALGYVINGLKELPGRKAVVVISDGFRIRDRDGQIFKSLRNLTEQANRAAVVIYTIDGRGQQTLAFTAADDIKANEERTFAIERELLTKFEERRNFAFETQEGLRYLAAQTGGFFNPTINVGITRVLDDQQGFYLIGYDPDESTFSASSKRRDFHKVAVKVKRSDLRVRTRTGFMAITDEEFQTVATSRREQLISAVSSPFAASLLDLRLTALFSYDRQEGPLLRSLIHIDASDLSFTDEADDWHKANFDIIAVAYGENGAVVEQISRNHTLRVRGETYQRVLKDGFVYILNFPAKKPGAYQLRAALRDATNARIGSASQFVRVPEIKSEQIKLSGIFLSGKAQIQIEPVTNQTQFGNEVANSQLLMSAVRKFRRGMALQYSYHIYNPQLDRAGKPQLKTQVKLFHDGQEIFAGQQTAFDVMGQKEMQKLIANGRLYLGTELNKGEYIMQITVIDELAQQKRRVARQLIDFEIVD